MQTRRSTQTFTFQELAHSGTPQSARKRTNTCGGYRFQCYYVYSFKNVIAKKRPKTKTAWQRLGKTKLRCHFAGQRATRLGSNLTTTFGLTILIPSLLSKMITTGERSQRSSFGPHATHRRLFTGRASRAVRHPSVSWALGGRRWCLVGRQRAFHRLGQAGRLSALLGRLSFLCYDLRLLSLLMAGLQSNEPKKSF